MPSILREPVIHFSILAVVLFGYFKLTADATPINDDTGIIVVDERDVEQLATQFQSVWKRPPTRPEIERLVDSYIREEVLVRSALELGLDQGDAAIRNRLRQKMQFLTDSAARAMEPETEVLQKHLDANPERFEVQGRIAFEQVLLGDNPTEAEVQATLKNLMEGQDPATLGQGSLLPVRIPLSQETQVDGGFGRGFFKVANDLPQGDWSGPLRSGFGLHLVRVTALEPAVLPELEQVRDKVLFDWRREQAEVLAEAQFEALKAGYQVERPDPDMLDKVVAE